MSDQLDIRRIVGCSCMAYRGRSWCWACRRCLQYEDELVDLLGHPFDSYVVMFSRGRWAGVSRCIRCWHRTTRKGRAFCRLCIEVEAERRTNNRGTGE